MRILCIDCVRRIFENRDYIYIITIKPPRGFDADIYKLGDYLRKRGITYFITRCQSVKGYIHFHGIISFNKSQTPYHGEHGNLCKKVNRDIGRVNLTPMQTSIYDVMTYIRSNRNTNNATYNQDDYYVIYFEHAC